MLPIIVAASGCAAAVQDANDTSQEKLRKRAAFDLDCEADRVDFEPLESYPNGYVTTWGVVGCGHKATYVRSSSGTWVMNSGPGGPQSPATEAPSDDD